MWNIGLSQAISIHALLAESDVCRWRTGLRHLDFNPRSPCGERPRQGGCCIGLPDFNPRSPCGERRSLGENADDVVKFQSTLSLRRATRSNPQPQMGCEISIHALLAESDIGGKVSGAFSGLFQSTLSLRRATGGCAREYPRRAEFQSTLSLRRATVRRRTPIFELSNFNPRSPCGERRCQVAPDVRQCVISIHALLAESDHLLFHFRQPCNNFNPRSPCGERPFRCRFGVGPAQFQSTLSLRRATPDL